MPIPFIILGAAALMSGVAVKKGVDGYKSHSDADELVDASKRRYNGAQSTFKLKEERAHSALASLGQLELDIGASFHEFGLLADRLLETLNAGRQDKIAVQLPKHQLRKIEGYAYSAVGVLGSVAGAGVAGAAAGFAVYGGVMALGAASTGTAISALSGVAATNATLAAIGGGALSAGGLGMAGGTAILGAAVAAPVLLIASWAYASHGEEALSNARKAVGEANAAIEKLRKAGGVLERTEAYVRRVEELLVSIRDGFGLYFQRLKDVSQLIEIASRLGKDAAAEANSLGDEIIRDVENGYAMAAILTDLMTTPVFKIRTEEGRPVFDAQGAPELEADADGSMVLNAEALDDALRVAESRHQQHLAR